MNIVRDVVVCLACGALILGVPWGIYCLWRIANACEAIRSLTAAERHGRGR